ncbi:MAG: glucosaminidase domain-containing protein [Saprospiraceae bacterium]|nr:glucosaminidase domain-containing protein [Saprospiraceae bacterium]
MSVLKFLTLPLCVLLLVSFDFSAEKAASDYIDQFKDLAVVEMYRTGIPASITLAQGLHESHYGTSKLATEANNHFGIKCKTYWTGKTYYHKDDDLNKRGQLIESCFRAYNSTVDSYVDRSNFLSQTERYQSLFKISRFDYAEWAKGLKNSGYATDPDYADKLIRKIEKYKLYIYDSWEDPFRHLLRQDKAKSNF